MPYLIPLFRTVCGFLAFRAHGEYCNPARCDPSAFMLFGPFLHSLVTREAKKRVAVCITLGRVVAANLTRDTQRDSTNSKTQQTMAQYSISVSVFESEATRILDFFLHKGSEFNTEQYRTATAHAGQSDWVFSQRPGLFGPDTRSQGILLIHLLLLKA